MSSDHQDKIKPLIQLLDRLRSHYTSSEYYNTLVEAKEQYWSLMGHIDTDAGDHFEHQMRCFDDWYLLHFIPKGHHQTFIQQYANSICSDEEIAMGLTSSRYSLYRCEQMSRGSKGTILRDLLNKERISLNKDQRILVEGDLFTGHVMTFAQQHHLLPGPCSLPRSFEAPFMRILQNHTSHHQGTPLNYPQRLGLLLRLERLSFLSLSSSYTQSDIQVEGQLRSFLTPDPA